MIFKSDYSSAFKILKSLKNQEKAKVFGRFFKTGKGEYGEGDKFLGLSSPQMQKIAKEFVEMSFDEIRRLFLGRFHEERTLAVLILVLKFKKASEGEKKIIAKFYLSNSKFINNWDLVDVSAYKILGPYSEMIGTKFLFGLAKSKILWERRMSIISTFHFIKKGESKITLDIVKMLLNDREDLMHKAVGWMLREVGKKCGEEIEKDFLKVNYKNIPRTALRYAIERFNEKERRKYLKGLL